MWDIYSKLAPFVGLVFREVRWLLAKIRLWIWPVAELDWIQELDLGESAELYRGMLAFFRLVKQVKRERTRKQQRCPTEAISFPTECCALQVALYFLSVLFVLSEKGLFGFSGLRSFSRSLATSVERACWGSSMPLPA